MNMEGKRFGAGLVAGLLLGLVVVTASSGSSFSFGLFGSFTSNPSAEVGLKSLTSTTTLTTSTSSQPTSSPSQSALNSTSYVVGRSSTTSTTGPPAVFTDLSSATTPKFSSHVDSIAQQPVLTNAVILLPVLVAFLLGAVLYRASTKRTADGSEEAK